MEKSIQNNVSLMDVEQWIELINAPSFVDSKVNGIGCISDRSKLGFAVRVSKNNFGVIFGSEFSPFLYRGENKLYADFVPSAQRRTQPEFLLDNLIDYVKKKEFIQLFKETPYYDLEKLSILGYSYKFDTEAIAQHYGFITDYIDVTKSKDVAKFFAYTYLDKNGLYKPIEDFEQYTPVLYTVNLKDAYCELRGKLKIIGFQAMLRPILQQALALDLCSTNGIKRLFRQEYLPCDKQSIYKIYDFFHGGECLLPELDNIAALIKEVKNNKSLYRGYIVDFCTIKNVNFNSVREKIADRGYSITEQLWGIPKERYKKMEKLIYSYILPFFKNNVGYRRVAIPCIHSPLKNI